MKLTVYFDGQFWCGLVEYTDEEENYRAYRHVFGQEPKEKEIFQFIYHQLAKIADAPVISTGISKNAAREAIRLNPKKMQRKIAREKKQSIFSTKAQQALSKQREVIKKINKDQTKRKKLEQKEAVFLLKQKKKLEKHKGH